MLTNVDARHWNSIADSYDQEIFNVFKNDKKRKLKRFVSKYANKKNTAIDFGCGTGKALPLLAPFFKEIIGIDVSKKCIAVAKNSPYTNVTFKEADLAAAKLNVPAVDFAFCCNVAMSDNVKRNYRILRNVLNSLNKGGVALIVLPSLESVSISALTMMRWYEKDGVNLAQIPKKELRNFRGDNAKHLSEGIVNIEGHPTKHYLFTELYALFNNGDFELQKLDRLEYGWDTEFESPPKWMQEPYPWDWVAEVKRVK